MNRRVFLLNAGVVSAGVALPSVALPGTGRLFGSSSSSSSSSRAEDGWRTFEVTTKVEVLQPAGVTRVWLPTPLTTETPYQRALGQTMDAAGGTARVVTDAAAANGIACFEWPAGVKPVATLTARVTTRDYTVAVPKAAPRPQKSAAASSSSGSISRFLQPSKLVCTDGIVLETATKITRGATSDVDKARAIYEWIVENTFRDPKTRGCGVGDIRAMLESGYLGGKCADLNALYVGLARAAGLPARHVYGLRVAKSDRGFASLGPATDNVTKGQHCRVEVYLSEHGWTPVDPADVRKVALEEPPGNLPLESEPVQKARAMLFGAWEMNWVAFNFAADVALPGSSRAPVGYFMYPQAETADGRLDSFDPDHFTYHITAHEIDAKS